MIFLHIQLLCKTLYHILHDNSSLVHFSKTGPHFLVSHMAPKFTGPALPLVSASEQCMQLYIIYNAKSINRTISTHP